MINPVMAKIAINAKTNQKGFTLIELLVALVIFAMLAVSGWQIMDSITKSRDRANLHLSHLSQLQYAYLQLSQDIAQTTNYVAVPAGIAAQPAVSGDGSTAAALPIKATLTLTAHSLDFIRLASPDPRLNPSPSLARVVYTIDNEKLIKQRFYQLNNPNETPNASVLLTEMKDAKWTAFTPNAVDNFPDAQTLQRVQQAQQLKQSEQKSPNTAQSQPQTTASFPSPTSNNTDGMTMDLTPYQQLPKGIELSFRYHDEPVVWRFALPESAPTVASKTGAN